MNENKKDSRIPKIWYLPDKWEQSGEKFDESKSTTNFNFRCDDESNGNGNEILKLFPHIFLSRAPLTFGHSQLVIPLYLFSVEETLKDELNQKVCPEMLKESFLKHKKDIKLQNPKVQVKKEDSKWEITIEETEKFEIRKEREKQTLNVYKIEEDDVLFDRAATIISIAIKTFVKAFKQQEIHTGTAYKDLAEWTLTKGKYIKTLVLRSSAGENVGTEYKVHLVPYFESHEKKCQQRFNALHPNIVDDNKRGGLLGWLGEREDEVDKLEVDPSPVKYTLDEIVKEKMRMEELAEYLREPLGAKKDSYTG